MLDIVRANARTVDASIKENLVATTVVSASALIAMQMHIGNRASTRGWNVRKIVRANARSAGATIKENLVAAKIVSAIALIALTAMQLKIGVHARTLATILLVAV